MITPEIISYVKEQRAKNTPDSEIKSNLLANGWTESDVAQAMLPPGALGAPKPPLTPVELKEHRKKVLWDTFASLIALDILIIVAAKLIYGTWGVFGISLLSIVLRVLVIYLFASYSVRGATPGDNRPKSVVKTIARIIGTVVVGIIIFIGLFYIYCLYVAQR